jgi:ferrous iron transport protein B
MANLASCHPATKLNIKHNKYPGRQFTIALAGNANVGKSVIFNQLTGSNQVIGNWPGKTVERAQGFLRREGCSALVVDLPGIYSLSTFSVEEIVTREYIAKERPDVIINVISAAVLERNLFFSLQLLEIGLPMVICLNQVDIADRKGIEIDSKRLEKILGVPVVPTNAANRKGIGKLIETAIRVAEREQQPSHNFVKFDNGIETGIDELTRLVSSEKLAFPYPGRWVGVKLLEGDSEIKEIVSQKSEKVIRKAEILSKRLEEAYGQPAFVTIASGRYELAGQIAQDVQRQLAVKPSFNDRIDRLTTHKVFGYISALLVIAGLLLWTFTVGSFLSSLLSSALSFFKPIDPQVSGTLLSIIWNGAFGGFVAGATLVVPFVIPFYLMLAALEDSGILTRVAFMLDSAMHQMGLHGKAIIPIILGYGCNVPAIYTTRIMSTRRERILAGLAITFAPCAARTIIILGLVAAFVNIWWALALYVADILIMFAVVKVAYKTIPGEKTGLIMEIHSFKTPSLSIMTKQTWARTKSLIFMVFPIYMISSAAVQAAYGLGWLGPVDNALAFLTAGWLGLPVIAGTLLVFGAARKELILLMAVVIFGTNLAAVLTPVQLIVLALVGTIYPCLATIGTLTREFGWKPAWGIIGANLGAALVVGGIAARVLGLVL